MKKRHFALAVAFVFALALTGCSANRVENSDPVEPTYTQPGATHTVPSGGSDATQGGGAGGTNDRDNDGLPDGGTVNDGAGNAVDDIGDAAGDLARGAGDVVRGAGDAIGDAANDVGRAMK